jgi:hypothetical protein
VILTPISKENIMEPDLTFETDSDIGSIRIDCEDAAIYFSNGYGDGVNVVNIYENQPYGDSNFFIGNFDVKTKATLSEYDCANRPLYLFKKGRWFVYRQAEGLFSIEYVDNDVSD